MRDRRWEFHLPSIQRDRLSITAIRFTLFVAALVVIAGGIFLLSRRGSAQQTVHINPDDIAPALALRSLAGDSDALILDQALEENKLETALATLLYSTSLSDSERATYYVTLGQKYAEARQKARAIYCYDQASTILLLSSAPFDAEKANLHLTLGQNLAAIGDRAEAERNLDFAYTIARYSPYVEGPQRRFVLSNLASAYKSIDLDKKADESTRAQSSLSNSTSAPTSPAAMPLPDAPLGDEVKAATAWRMRAAQRLINSLGSKSDSQIEQARRNLEDALRAEDDLRSLVLESRLGQAATTDVKAALAKSRLEWQTLRLRIAEKGFGLSLSKAWEGDLAAIRTLLRQATANYFLLRRELAVNLPDPLDAAQARLDLLRQEMMLGKIGLYPDYPENRLITEMAQATKERIDLREDGLYVAVLSQEGRGLLVITTADLWGRPAAMASAGLGMSFPTMRPPIFAYAPSPTLLPTQTPAAMSTPLLSTPTTQRTALPQATQSLEQTPQPEPTQPTSPNGMAPTALPTRTRPTQPTPAFTLPTPAPLPTPVPIPTATFAPLPTPTPAYNYIVLYEAGPTVRKDTGNDNFHIVGMVVDQGGILIPGVEQRLSWCCPAGQAVHPRPTIDVDNGRFDFFIGRGQFTLDIIDGAATTQPVVINTDVQGLTGYVEWEYTFQRTNLGYPSGVPTRTSTPTPTASPSGTPPPPSPTPPLPGATTARLTFEPGWNFVALPLSPVTSYSAATLQAEINSQINSQGGGVATVSAWDGSSIKPYGGNISLGTGYILNITGTNRVYWQMTGYALPAPVPLSLNQTQKNSVSFPYMRGGFKTAADVRSDLDSVFGAGTFVRLYRMRDTTGYWEWYDGTPTGIASFTLAPDRGYLLEVSRSVTWSPWQSATPTLTPTATPTASVTPTPTATPFDTYEPNNSFDQAVLVPIDNPVVSYISYPQDRDFFKFNLPAAGTIYASLTNLPDDYDLYLYNASRQEIDASFQGGQTSEYITKTVSMSGIYYILVQGAGPAYDTIKPYKLLINSAP